MSSTVPDPSGATLRETLAGVRGKPIKADLRPQAPDSRLRDVAADALRRTSSQKAAAIDIDLSEGRLSHKLQDGTLTLAQLEALGPVFAAKFGKDLVEKFGPLADPRDHARRLCDDIQALVNQLRQFVDAA